MLICLVGKIKGLVFETERNKAIIARLRKRPDAEKCSVRIERARICAKELGKETRHYLLALAFINGMPYNRLERRCNVAPNADKILRIVQDYGLIHRKPVMISMNDENMKLKIINWLNGEV